MSFLCYIVSRVTAKMPVLFLLIYILFSCLACKKEIENPDLAFVFAGLSERAVKIGYPFTLNMRVINEIYSGKQSVMLPEDVKPSGACSRAIVCEFRPDSAGLWERIQFQDVHGEYFDEVIKPLTALGSGETANYVEGIVCMIPGEYRFRIDLDCLDEVVERNEENNLVTNDGMLRSGTNFMNLTVKVTGLPNSTSNVFLRLMN